MPLFSPLAGHFDNEGNPGMALILDQIGLNARTMDDIILVDSALSGYDANEVVPEPQTLPQLRVGVPVYPFVHAYVPAGVSTSLCLA
jgi:Asp-tRNA(Asn)/Glu-tRNA(Gln) amidotransferase A subunit family amidase